MQYTRGPLPRLGGRGEGGREPYRRHQPSRDAPLVVQDTLYRIAQEALNNILKHAKARHVTLTLARGPEAITLEVRDDGIGFDPSGPFPGHLGQRTMRERAARLGGSIEIDSTPGHGARVRVRIPVGTNTT